MEQKTKGMSKKNIYLILLSLAIVAVVIAVTVALANSSSEQIETGRKSSQTTSVSQSVSTSEKSSSEKSSSEKSTSSSSSKGNGSAPTTAPIVFVNPVESGYLLTEYTEASLVYNKTLGIYSGHMGIDIAGAENAKVFAVYDGQIESITSDYLTGTTVTVVHADGLKTVYNSIDVKDGLSQGQAVAKGQELGVISTNNRQEYKDGAHLHFEVMENNKNIDPFKYLDIDGK